MDNEILSDFNVPWCQALIQSPDYDNLGSSRRPPPPIDQYVTNTLVSETLMSESTIRAWLYLRSKDMNPDYVSRESVLLLSLGAGLSGPRDVLHGGMQALLLDQAMAMCATTNFGPSAVTSESSQKFIKGVKIPGVVVCRAVATKEDGRRISFKGTLEDGAGTIFCEAKSIFTLRGKQSGKPRI